MTDQSKKLILLGLDGGTLNIIEGMIEEGKLPTFESLMEEGVYGKLESTIPPITIPAWISMFTGMTPENLGVIDRFKLDRGYHQDLNRPSLKGKYFWDELGKNEYKTGIVNPPGVRGTYEVNGFFLSGFSQESEVYPENFNIEREEASPQKIKETSNVVGNILENIENKERTILSLLGEDWDMLTVVLQETDHVTHLVDDWNGVERVYERMDELLSKLLEEAEGCNILIASDHGIKKIERRVYVNSILEKIGLLEKSDNVSGSFLSKAEEIARKVFGSSRVKSLANTLPFIHAQEIKERMGIERIDKDRTKLFGYGARAGGYPRLWINSKKRFERGIVDEDEIDSVKEEFVQKLDDLGKCPIEEVYDGDEIYSEKARWVPDLIAKLEPDCMEDYKLSSKIEERDNGFGHALQGIFVGYGPEIRSDGSELNNLRIQDIAPTVLHFFDVTIPNEMDGMVLREIFESESEPSERDVQRENFGEKKSIERKIKELKSEDRI